MWTDFVAYNMRCLRQVNGLGQLSRASRVFGVWRGRSRDQVCAIFLRYVDDCGAKKCGALVVCQDSLADALDDVLDRREAPECGDLCLVQGSETTRESTVLVAVSGNRTKTA